MRANGPAAPGSDRLAGDNDARTPEGTRRDDAIITHGLTKQFGRVVAVNHVDLAIHTGEIFSLLGPNGAGKTTTIKLLSGLLKPTSGSATLMGYDIGQDPISIKRIISVSPQETAVAAHLTVRENVLLMGGVYGLTQAQSDERAAELIELLGLHENRETQARKLSGGMQRRLSIAMALVSDPQILFLDEPTLGLDPKARRNLWRQIEGLKGRKTILLTTHYLEEADALADRIAIIRNGDIIALGTSARLKRELVGKQSMVVRGENITEAVTQELQDRYPATTATDSGLEIRSEKLDFEDIVGFLHARGVRIEWLTMREPTLDEVFLRLTEEVANAGEDEER